MAGTRSESWWQPPKDFEAPIDPEQVLDEATAPKNNTAKKQSAAATTAGGWDGWGGRTEGREDPGGSRRTREADADDADLVVPVGWTIPTGDVAPPDPSNRRFYFGVVLIAVATAVGVLAALRLAPADKDSRRSTTSTTAPSAVRGETTVRKPGALSTACLDEKNRVQRAEQTYAAKDASHQYADMGGLVASGALTAPSSWFVIVNENLGTPPLVQVNGVALHEYEDFLVVPVPGGPCDTTT